MKITDTIDVAAPREKVFALFCDIPNAAEHISGIDSIEVIEGDRFGVGFKWREKRTMMGKEATEEMWVVDFQPDSSYTVEAASHGMHYRTEITFEDRAPGTTVTQTFTGTPVSTVAKLMTPIAWLFKAPTKKALRKDLEELKSLLEA